MLKSLIIFGLLATASVQPSPLHGNELEFPVEEVPKEAALATFDQEDEVEEDYDDEGEGRSIFSVIRAVVSQGVKHGAKHGAKVLGSAVMVGAKKVVKTGVMKTAKKLVWKGTKKVVGLAAEELAMQGIEAGIGAIQGGGEEAQEGDEVEEVEEVDLFEYLADDELCECPDNNHCSCCAEVPEYETACLNLTFIDGGSLWKKNSQIRVSSFYGDEKALIHKFPVNSDMRKCRRLPESMESVKMCVSSLGKQKEGDNQAICFMIELNGHSLLKCMQQEKNGKLKMENL